MAFTLRVFVLLCGLSALMPGAWSVPKNPNICCPEGWTQLDARCYIFKAESRTFIDAESVCNILGGNLVSILSALENSLVQKLILVSGASEAWIGLHDAVEDDQFFWTDGSEFKFENFAQGEPGNDECVVIQTSGTWEGESCDDPEPYVCLRDAVCPRH
ncbi:ladderlectin-like [Entelurus aequoreus]|uniref:ladderlectin-like n=1 Tax=Entelurus aequoreus TaxID=161455 RepID=UPI002B1E6C6E|nr:ladderlectin-like [Entelurus aequoreus]